MVGTIYKPKYRPSLVKVLFNGANMALASAAGYVFVRRMIPGLAEQPALLCLILGAAAFYAVDGNAAQARFGAANLDVLAFALVPFERDARQPAHRVGHARVG